MSNLLDTLKNSHQSDVQEKQAKMAKVAKRWAGTGLLEGITSKQQKLNVAQLLENQLKQLVKEASTMSNGDVEGYAAVAFPLVRRVFGELIAEKLVSVQPMSMPTGLIFFLDFVYANNAASEKMGIYTGGESVYGGDKVGSGITEGLNVDEGSKGFYDLNNGYSSPYVTFAKIASVNTGGAIADDRVMSYPWSDTTDAPYSSADIISQEVEADIQNDVAVLNDGGAYEYRRYIVQLSAANWARLNLNDIMTMNFITADPLDPLGGEATLFDTGAFASLTLLRRLTTLVPASRQIIFIVRATTADAAGLINTVAGTTFTGAVSAMNDKWINGSSLGSIAAEDWYMEGPHDKDSEYGVSGEGWQEMPEIDIRINSVEIKAITKKLKAKYTPELAQDLNVYQNVDAETELTGIMADHINLEINNEILVDLVKGQTAGRLYWSRRPGVFLDQTTGLVLTSPPDFTGNVSEWYETLLERINDLSATIHRKTLKGGANFIVCSPEVSSILAMTNGYRSVVEVDSDGNAGVVKAGNINKMWDVYVYPYFPRNIILVGRQGKSFLESGYVYAPYVPLQFTPTIYGPEDFVPRKGASTRYAKRMVRPDMYGLIEVRHLKN